MLVCGQNADPDGTHGHYSVSSFWKK